MERGQFTFYRSYYVALRLLSPADREQAVMALCAYALDGQEVPLEGPAALMLLLVKPTLDTARVRAEAGSRTRSNPPENKPGTKPEQTPNKKENENKNEIENERETEREAESEGAAASPPRWEAVLAFARKRGREDLARPFFDYYTASGWRDRDGRAVHSWKQRFISWQNRERTKERDAPSAQENLESIRSGLERMRSYAQARGLTRPGEGGGGPPPVNNL